MIVEIKETRKREELVLIDRETDCEWEIDLISDSLAFNDGQFCYDEDKDVYICDQGTFDWWDDLISRYQKAEDARYDFLKDLDYEQKEEAESTIWDAYNCELDFIPEAIIAAIEEIKERGPMSAVVLRYSNKKFAGGRDNVSLTVRRDSKRDCYRLWTEAEGGDIRSEAPKLNTEEMEDFLEGSGLTQKELCELVSKYNIFG